jgi:hypothetical protein
MAEASTGPAGLSHRTASGRLDVAAVATSCAIYLLREEHETVGEAVRRVWGFRPIGVVAAANGVWKAHGLSTRSSSAGARSEMDRGEFCESPSGASRSPPAGAGVRQGGRLWLYVRPGLQRPLACPPELLPPSRVARLVLVFDLNGVLCAKLGNAAGPAHVRTPGGMGFVMRPGAAKLLRVCAAAGHEVWLWSTMQRATVDAVAAVLAPWIPPGRRLSAQDCTGGALKDLRRIWDQGAGAAARPAAKVPDLVDRTLLFDDDPSKGALQPANVVAVPRFAPRDVYDVACVSDRGAIGMLTQVARRSMRG